MINESVYPIIAIGDVFDDELKLRASSAEWSQIKNLVYWIESMDDRAIYVGSTVTGIRSRLNAHIRQKTKLGQFIVNLQPASMRWRIHVFPVDSAEIARQAEMAIIEKAKPALNSYGVDGWNEVGNQLIQDLLRWNGEAPPIDVKHD